MALILVFCSLGLAKSFLDGQQNNNNPTSHHQGPLSTCWGQVLLILSTALHCYYSYFTDEETEVLGRLAPCPGSHNEERGSQDISLGV